MHNISDGRSLTLALQGFLANMGPAARATKLLLEGMRGRPAPERILCLGKAAHPLAEVAASLWPGVAGMLYSTAPRRPAPPAFECLWGEHPFPTPANLRRTLSVERWLELTRGPLLACVSGGGSALLVHPRHPWTLEMKSSVTRELWARGAPISDLNAVRRRLSEVKGGGLRRMAGPWPVTTALWSDVSWRDRRLVSSGPTTAWRSRRTAEEVVERYGLRLPLPLPKEDSPRSVDGDACFVMSDGVALRREAVRWLKGNGFGVTEVTCGEGEPARSVAGRMAGLACDARRGPHAFVGTGETRVDVAGRAGVGGRCTHLVAEVVLALASSKGVRRWAICALATDGVDGCAGGGAWCDDAQVPPSRELSDALAAFDTGALWKRCGSLVSRRATGDNRRDLWVLAVWP
jgi:glycerate 2-kinase